MKAYMPDPERMGSEATADGLALYLATGELPRHAVVPAIEPSDYDDGGVLGFLYDTVPEDYFAGKASLARTRRLQAATGLVDPGLGNAIREQLRRRWKLKHAA